LSQTLKQAGENRTRQQFSTLFIYLTLLLTFLTILIALPLFLLADHFTNPIWRIAALLTPILMPYSIFICAVGVMTSCLNMKRVYFLPSLTAILQNLVIISALFFLCPLFDTGWGKVRIVSFSVLVAGVLEFLFMLWLLKREHLMLTFTGSVWKDLASLKEIFTVALPGIVAAGAHIISTQADRLISGNIPNFAGEIGQYATSALYYSDRLVLLPVGVFAFSFGTVALTELSHAHADNDLEKFRNTLGLSLRNLMFLTIPMTVFLFVFAEPVLRLLFMRGAFGQTALEQTLFALRFYVFGIPAFAAMKLTTASFTARKDMKTPFYTGLIAIAVNIILNLALMVPLRQGGIALATVLASFLNNTLLLILLEKRTKIRIPVRSNILFLAKMAAASLLPLAAAVPVFRFLKNLCPGIFWSDLTGLAAAGIFYGILLLVLAKVLKLSEAQNVLKKLLRR
ncbi:MAG: polysaccharide biosynthesis protein, partial [Lentisphaeria bacterium]|nr:polysaccharide biosynthesis protein [Lentisphaeria bacterium]